MPNPSDERREAFERHVRRAEFRRRVTFAAPVLGVIIPLFAAFVFVNWWNTKAEACGLAEGVVARAGSEATLTGHHDYLVVKGDDGRTYHLTDPHSDPAPVGHRIAVEKMCGLANAVKPIAHFDHWLTGGDAVKG